MPDVPKGTFYLGDTLNPADHKRANKPVLYEAANLTTHGVIVGMTGSGKTGLGMCLLEEALLAGVPTTLQARDRGFNQPGAAGNRRGLRRR